MLVRIRMKLILALALVGALPGLVLAQDQEAQDQQTQQEEPASESSEGVTPAVDSPAENVPGEGETAFGTAPVGGEMDEPPPLPPPPPPPPPPGAATPVADTDGSVIPDVPIWFDLHGYFRSRLAVYDAMPYFTDGTRDGATDAAFGFMRLRLDPTISFGTNRQAPLAALRAQIDVLDNVVFGDNARLTGTPLFANDPSTTALTNGINWGNNTPPIFIRRLWLEFMTPVGQIRIGRQPSHGGLGLLFNDGNDFRNDFGDALGGTTFDRILFATRPMSIVNALTTGDSRPTPFVFALAYDWLVEDQLTYGASPSFAGPVGERDFYAGLDKTRSPFPYGFLTDRAGEDDVYQTSVVLVWDDQDFNMTEQARDVLQAGFIGTYRGQASTSSDIWIGDLFYKLRWTPVRRGPGLYTEGELYTIQGRSNAVALTGDFCPMPTGCTAGGEVTPYGRTATTIGANIWGGAMRLGIDDDLYAVTLESGFSTGQQGSIIGSPTLTQRPNNNNYQIGLLLYPVVLNVRTAAAYQLLTSSIWSNGGVWNSIYYLLQGRYRPLGYHGGVELIGQFLLAFADQLNLPLRNTRGASGGTACGMGSECMLGWEADVALKASWGPHDELRWSNEFGIMGVGDALGAGGDATTGNKLSEPIIWTLQSRIAFVF